MSCIGPICERQKDRPQPFSQFGQPILNFRRHLWVDRPYDDAVSLELTKVLRQHLLRGLWYGPFQVRESHHRLSGEMGKDRHLPSSVNTAERIGQTVGTNESLARARRYCLCRCHGYLLVGTPLKSAYFYLFSGNSTVTSGRIFLRPPVG